MNDDDEWDLPAFPAAATAGGDAADDDDFFASPSSTTVPTLRNAAVPIALAAAAVSAAVSSQSAAAAAVNRWAPKAMVHFDWGQRHPDYNKQVKRASWSIEEKAWIQDWINAHPDQVTGHARCLKDIQANAAARAIFHSIHVLDSARLRAGFEAAVKSSVL